MGICDIEKVAKFFALLLRIPLTSFFLTISFDKFKLAKEVVKLVLGIDVYNPAFLPKL